MRVREGEKKVQEGEKAERGEKEKGQGQGKGEAVGERMEGVLEGVKRSGQDVYKVAVAVPGETVNKVKQWVGFSNSSSAAVASPDDGKGTERKEAGGENAEGKRNEEDARAVRALPIVVLKNYNAGKREEVADVFAQWAAGLVDNQVWFLIPPPSLLTAEYYMFRSRMSSSSPTTARTQNVSQRVRPFSLPPLPCNIAYSQTYTALPSKPLNTIALYDADSASALQFVKQRLHESNIDADFTEKQMAYIERLGGRASDLASVRLFLPSSIFNPQFSLCGRFDVHRWMYCNS